MKLIRHLNDLTTDLRGGAVSVGNFDGVHQGHASIVGRLIAAAGRVAGPAVVFTFDPHPVRLLRPQQSPPPLTWTDRKAELLAALGVDVMIAYPTDEALLRLTAREFFDEIICRRLGARAMVEGPNFCFGRDRQGTTDTLRAFAGEAGISLEVVDALHTDGDTISSSRIRHLIAAGDVEAAGGMLTQPYRIRGMVTHGAGRGAKIGFPTANLEAIDTLLPSQGVYAGAAYVGPARHAAAINLGPNPTFGEGAVKVEVHVIGYTGSLYGQPLEVELLRRLRGVEPFESVEALKRQLTLDIREAAEIAAQRAAR